MPTNDFLPFGSAVGANVITQAEYAALAARLNGFSSGTAASMQLNKAWRQSSSMASALGQLIVNSGNRDALDDGNIPSLVSGLSAAISAISSISGTRWDLISNKPTTLSGYGITDAAPINSPQFAGSPTANTPADGDNSSKLSNTNFVVRAIANALTQATETVKGILQIATQTDVNNGVDDTKAVTAKKIKSGIFNLIGYTPIQQGGGIGQLANKIYIGFSGAKAKITVDSSDLGNIITDSDTATDTLLGISRRATQAETDAGSNGTAFIVPATLRFGFQFIVGTNGAIILPSWLGGFILQWGSVSLNDGTSSQITFPVQFVTSRLATWSSVNVNIASWSGTVPGTSTSGGTNTLANMIVAYNDNGGMTGVPVSWFALGK